MIFGHQSLDSLLQATIPGMSAESATAEAHFMERECVRLLTPRTGTLPPRLMVCSPMPRALFVKGTCDLTAPRSVAIVGTRRATAAGIEFCRRFVADLAEMCPETLIISGLAYGIDVAAHRAALECEMPTAAVVAHGLDTLYPADHRDIATRIVRSGRGAIVTEYTSGTRIHRSNFLSRNRIVAALAAATIVVESSFKGGALYTARMAHESGRPVFAVPGRWNDRASEGTNNLIATGKAKLITSAADFINAMCWTPSRQVAAKVPTLDFTSLEGNARIIADYLRANPETTHDELTAAVGLPSGEVSARIMEMELDDLLTVLPGGRFQLNF